MWTTQNKLETLVLHSITLHDYLERLKLSFLLAAVYIFIHDAFFYYAP